MRNALRSLPLPALALVAFLTTPVLADGHHQRPSGYAPSSDTVVSSPAMPGFVPDYVEPRPICEEILTSLEIEQGGVSRVVGMPADEVRVLLEDAGMRAVRVVADGDVMTMDYRYDRATILRDAQMRVLDLRCG